MNRFVEKRIHGTRFETVCLSEPRLLEIFGVEAVECLLQCQDLTSSEYCWYNHSHSSERETGQLRPYVQNHFTIIGRLKEVRYDLARRPKSLPGYQHDSSNDTKFIKTYVNDTQ